MEVGIRIHCRAAQNNGIVHGRWIYPGDYDDGVEVQEAIDSILERSPCANAKEWYVAGGEGIDTCLANSLSLNQWIRYATLAEKHGEAYAVWVNNKLTDDPSILDEQAFLSEYVGEFHGEHMWRDFARDRAERLGYLLEMPKHLRGYFVLSEVRKRSSQGLLGRSGFLLPTHLNLSTQTPAGLPGFSFGAPSMGALLRVQVPP